MSDTVTVARPFLKKVPVIDSLDNFQCETGLHLEETFEDGFVILNLKNNILAHSSTAIYPLYSYVYLSS
jgi:hypothetical protein